MDKEKDVCVCVYIYIYKYIYIYIYIIYTHNEILFTHKKEGNTAICDNMDEPGGHYPKWNKPDTEGQILYDTTHMMNIKEQNSEADSRIGVARVWGEEGTGRICQRTQSCSYRRWIVSPRDLLYTTVPVVDNTVLYA